MGWGGVGWGGVFERSGEKRVAMELVCGICEECVRVVCGVCMGCAWGVWGMCVGCVWGPPEESGLTCTDACSLMVYAAQSMYGLRSIQACLRGGAVSCGIAKCKQRR